MTETEALEELQLMVAHDVEPTLDVDELASLLLRARRPDPVRLGADSTGWTPTWDLNAAAAEGWRRKAAKVTGKFDFSTDGQSFSRSQIHAMCIEQANLYRNRIAGSIPMNLPIGEWDTDISVNTNV